MVKRLVRIAMGMDHTMEHIEYVIRNGITPERAHTVVRQVEACQRAGIGSTFEEAFKAWVRVNVPTKIRDRIVGGGSCA